MNEILISEYPDHEKVKLYNQVLQKSSEVGKAQLEAQSAISATSAIAEVALRFNFLF